MLENSLFYKKLNTILIERLPIICKSLNSSMAQQLEESDIFLEFKYSSFKNQYEACIFDDYYKANGDKIYYLQND